jgi:hypothetical protein
MDMIQQLMREREEEKRERECEKRQAAEKPGEYYMHLSVSSKPINGQNKSIRLRENS